MHSVRNTPRSTQLAAPSQCSARLGLLVRSRRLGLGSVKQRLGVVRLRVVEGRAAVREELVEKVRALLVQAGVVRVLVRRVVPDGRVGGLEARDRGLHGGHNRERRLRVLLLLRVDHHGGNGKYVQVAAQSCASELRRHRINTVKLEQEKILEGKVSVVQETKFAGCSAYESLGKAHIYPFSS